MCSRPGQALLQPRGLALGPAQVLAQERLLVLEQGPVLGRGLGQVPDPERVLAQERALVPVLVLR